MQRRIKHLKGERVGGGAKFHRAVREDLSDKVNFKVRSEDSRRRVFQAMERVVTIQSSWTGKTVKCVCRGVEGGDRDAARRAMRWLLQISA